MNDQELEIELENDPIEIEIDSSNSVIVEKNYNNLNNKPQINGITLQGNKTSADLNLQQAEEGKGLSTNDYTNEDKIKLANIEAEAEVNIIESVVVNNVTATIENKTATIEIETGKIDSISVNGVEQTIDQNKNVDISVPTALSDLNDDSTHRTVTDTEKTTWNAKADISDIPTTLAELTDDSTHRTVTDTEKQTWNNKSDFSGNYNDLTNKPTIPTKTSDLNNDSGFIDNTVNNLTNYTLKTATGSLIDLEINGTTYVITLSLKNQDGTVISTDTIDLPLESVVVGGSYDAINKKIVLTLENGNTVDIPVGDLIAGLQTEITSNNKLASDLVDDSNSGNKFVSTSEKSTWNGKYDKPSGGIPKTDLANDVQASLNKADTALQQHQDISGKEDKSNKVTTIDTTTPSATEYPSESAVVTYVSGIVGNIESILEELDIGGGVQ